MFDRAPGERGAGVRGVARSPAGRAHRSQRVGRRRGRGHAGHLRSRAASQLLVDAVTLVEGLPATLAALAAGDLSPAHARAMVELAGPVADPAKRAQVEAAVLPRAAETDRSRVAGLRCGVPSPASTPTRPPTGWRRRCATGTSGSTPATTACPR